MSRMRARAIRRTIPGGSRSSACPSRVPLIFSAQVVLERCAALMVRRLSGLADLLEQGDETTWSDFLQTAEVLASLLPNLAPERRERLLTTAEMAARLGVEPKTLLRRRARGEIQPAVQTGKFIRWRGDEALRGNAGGNGRGKSSP